MMAQANTPTEPLADGETLVETFRADRGTYIRDHVWLAALAMAIGMGVLWLIGNPHVWTGAIGGLAAIAVRGSYLASEELAVRWDLTDRRLLGPGGRKVDLARIDKVRTLASAVQIVTIEGDKHLVRYQARPGQTLRAIDRVRHGGRP